MSIKILEITERELFFAEIPTLRATYKCSDILTTCIGTACSTCPLATQNIEDVLKALTQGEPCQVQKNN